MADKFKVAAVQMTSTDDVDRNLESALRLSAEAAGEGAGLVVLPECFALLGPEHRKLEIAEVLRDLSVLRATKDLSFGERKMLETARGLMVKELAIAKGVPEDKISAEIEAIFAHAAA